MFDADGHIIEDLHEIYEFLEPPYAGGLALGNGLKLGHGMWPQLDGFLRQAAGARTKATTEWRSSPEQWGELLDETGLTHSVLYPTIALSHGLIRDTDFSIALARAYNDWLAERYCSVDRRLKFVALLPLQDAEASALELRRAVTELGAVGGVLAAAGLREALGAAEFFPMYQEAEDLDVPLVVHGAPAAVIPDLFDRFSHLHVLAHPFLQMMSMASMFKAGVFDRFERLRIGYFEAGAAWAPFLVGRLDRTTGILGYEPYDVYRTGDAPRVPSDVIHSGQVFFSVEGEEPMLPHLLEELGSNCLCFASDFPHEQGNAKEVLAEADEIKELTSLTEDQKVAILDTNGRAMYGPRFSDSAASS